MAFLWRGQEVEFVKLWFMFVEEFFFGEKVNERIGLNFG